MSKSWSASSTPSASGMVVSTIGHRAAQAGPRDEGELAQRHRLHDRADQHRERPGHDGQDQAGHQRQRRRSPGRSGPGESSRPSITNSPIWASQATPSAKDLVAVRCGQLGVAEDERGDVDRGEAGGVHGGRGAVRDERQAQHRERVEARRRQRGPAHDPGAGDAARRGRPRRRPAQLEDDGPGDRRGARRWPTAPVEMMPTSTTVGASLSPDSASSAPVSRLGSGTHAQHREHRRRVGRRADRAEQDRQLPRQAEDVVGADGDDGRPRPRPRGWPARRPSGMEGRTSAQSVVRPPSARISASAPKPSAWASCGVLELDARGPPRRARRP